MSSKRRHGSDNRMSSLSRENAADAGKKRKSVHFVIGDTAGNNRAMEELYARTLRLDTKGTLTLPLTKQRLPLELVGVQTDWTFAIDSEGKAVRNTHEAVGEFLRKEAASVASPATPSALGSLTPQRLAGSPMRANSSARPAPEAVETREIAIGEVMDSCEREAKAKKAVTLALRDSLSEKIVQGEKRILKLQKGLRRAAAQDTESAAAIKSELLAEQRSVRSLSSELAEANDNLSDIKVMLRDYTSLRAKARMAEATRRIDLRDAHMVAATAFFEECLSMVSEGSRTTFEEDLEIARTSEFFDVVGFLHVFGKILAGGHEDDGLQLADTLRGWLSDTYPADSSRDFPSWLADQAKTRRKMLALPDHGSEYMHVSVMRSLINDCVLLHPLISAWSLRNRPIPATYVALHEELMGFYGNNRAAFDAAKKVAKEQPAFQVTTHRQPANTREDPGRSSSAHGPTATVPTVAVATARKPSKPACYQWTNRGSCDRGDACGFSHEGTPKPKSDAPSVCRKMMYNGKCSYDSKCTFASTHTAAKAFYDASAKTDNDSETKAAKPTSKPRK